MLHSLHSYGNMKLFVASFKYNAVLFMFKVLVWVLPSKYNVKKVLYRAQRQRKKVLNKSRTLYNIV